MKNEETTIMQPNNEQGHETQNQSAISETQKKSNTGQRVAATVGAAVIGGAAGAGGTIAAEHMMNGKEEPETKEAETKEEPAASASKTEGTHTQAKHETVAKEEPQSVPEDGTQDGPDYTGHNGANPTTPNPDVHQTNDPSSSNESAGIHAIDTQYVQTPDGRTAEAVIVTDGETVGAIIDNDGDGRADTFAADTNHNNHFDENEYQNIQGDNIRMEDVHQACAPQNGGTHQEPQTQTYTTNNNDSNEVQVLGVDSEQGIIVVSIEGEPVGLFDVNHDDIVEYAGGDPNHDGVIEEGEVIDVSSEQIHMSTVQDTCITQQQEQQQQEQQQQDTFAYNAGDDQSDYTNDADPQFT